MNPNGNDRTPATFRDAGCKKPVRRKSGGIVWVMRGRASFAATQQGGIVLPINPADRMLRCGS